MDSLPGERRRWALGGAAVIAAAVALAAILGAGPFGSGLTREELVAEGDRICAEAHEEFSALQEEAPRTAGEAAELTEALIEIAEDELDAIAGLDGPAELDEPLERYLDAREEGIELMREGLAAAELGHAQRYERAQARLARTQRDPRRRLARQVGFRECSRPLVGDDELSRQARRPAGAGLDAPPRAANP